MGLCWRIIARKLETPMSTLMSQFKSTANAHMRQEMERGEWVCECEACHAIRSLVGLAKMLAV